MAPYNQTDKIEDEYRNEKDKVDKELLLPAEIGTDENFKVEIFWPNVIGFAILHLGCFYGLYLMLYSKMWTNVFAMTTLYFASFGVTIGAHRLYTHKAFKAKWPLRLILVTLQTVAGQNCLYIWARDHRLHHKYSDTDADPHNANRGFFFCHMGWLMAKKHPLVISKGRQIDLSDLEQDSFVMFQKKYYKPLYAIFAVAIPVIIPVYYWDETWTNSIFVCYFMRFVIQLNGTWCVNSIAHLWGTKPFDKRLKPVESHFVGFISHGEGWHNYHHAFPYDYRAAELGSRYNLSEYIINCMAGLGLAYDLRVAPYSMIAYRAVKYGDGSHESYGKNAHHFFGKKYHDALASNTNDNSSETIYNRPVSVRG